MAFLQHKAGLMTGTANKKNGTRTLGRGMGSSSSMQRDLDMESTKLSTLEKILEQRDKFIKKNEGGSKGLDIHGINAMRTAPWLGVTPVNREEIFKDGDSEDNKESKMRIFIGRMENINKSIPGEKGTPLHAGLHLHGSDSGAERFIGALVLQLENTLTGIEFAKAQREKLVDAIRKSRSKKESKQASSSSNKGSDDEGNGLEGETGEEELSALTRSKKELKILEAAINKAEKEYATFEALSQSEEGIEVIFDNEEVKEHVKDFEMLEGIKTMLNEGDTMVLKMLSLRITDRDQIIAIEKAIKKPVEDTATGINQDLGINIGAQQMMKWIQSIKYVNLEELYVAKEELLLAKFNLNNLSNGGLIGELNKMVNMFDKVKKRAIILEDKNKEANSGLVNEVGDIIRTLMPKVHAASIEESSNGKLLQVSLQRYYQDIKTMKGSSEEKLQYLEDSFAEADAIHSGKYTTQKKDSNKKEWVLQTNGEYKKGTKGGGKGKDGRKGGKGGKGTCGMQARKGFCTRSDCRFEGLTSEQYRNRGDCRAENTEEGCKYPHCRFRRANDPSTITAEMAKKCVHQQRGAGSINQAEEVEVQVSMNDNEELVIGTKNKAGHAI